MQDLPDQDQQKDSQEIKPSSGNLDVSQGKPEENQGGEKSIPSQKVSDSSDSNSNAVNQPPTSQPSLTQNPEVQYPALAQEEEADINVEKPRSYWKLGLSLLLVLVFIGISSVLGIGVMVAYGKVNIENKELREKIVNIVFSIPFLPKTPEYILARSVAAHQEVSSANFDASLASSSESVASLIGSNNFDLSIKGPVDLSDKKHPKLDLHLQLTSELDGEIKLIDQDLYFRINKIPTVLVSMVTASLGDAPGFEGLDPLLGVWVHHKLETLDTEARRVLEEDKEEEPLDEVYREFIDRVFREKILPEVQMSKDFVDTFETHKLYVDLSGNLIDEVFEEIESIERERRGARIDVREKGPRPSEVIKKLVISLWVDRDSYYLRKVTVQVSMDNSALSEDLAGSSYYGSLVPTFKDTVDAVFSLKLSDIGMPVEVTAPQEFMTTEEFTTEAMKLLGMGSLMQDSMSTARFSGARFSVYQLSNNARMTYVEQKKYPGGLEELAGVMGYEDNSLLLAQFEEQEIKYKVSTDGQSLLIYSLIKNPANSQQPFYVMEHRGEDVTSKNYSAGELVEVLGRLGLEADAELIILQTPSLAPQLEIPSATGSGQGTSNMGGLM